MVFLVGLVGVCVLVRPVQAQYCSASGGGVVYICEVQFKTINNTGTGSDGYADYTSLSATMDIGMTYPTTITASIEEPFGHECSVWVDWNQDFDFDDPGEEIETSLICPFCITPFIARITPPEGVLLGDTRMRVRITKDETPNPCGTTFYGEVEDYTITVTDNNGCSETQYGGGCGTKESPYLIYTAEQLQAVGASSWTWDRQFRLMADIDLIDYTGSDFNIIGDGHVYYPITEPPVLIGFIFTGIFDGNGHVISNFRYDSSQERNIGLFGCVGYDGEIKNLGLRGPFIEAAEGVYVGSLAGQLHDGKVSFCYAEDGGVWGDTYVGGLVGHIYASTIRYSYSTCSVSGSGEVGGLVGYTEGSWIYNSYAKGDVSGIYYVGGLVGWNDPGSLNMCYSVGGVSGIDHVGGLIGWNNGCASFTSCFWDVNSSGLETSDGGIGKTTAEMKTKSTFTDAGWNFGIPIWKICDAMNYPKLAWQEPLAGDFVCPDGVDFRDFAVLGAQWQMERLPADVGPNGGDGIVNFLDWAVFATGWDGTRDMAEVAEFAEQWLKRGAGCADIGPDGGDGIVNELDLAVLADNWLVGVEN